MLEWLSGKKTLIGSLLLGLLGVLWSLDLLVDGQANWMTEDQYLALSATIAGLTGAAMRLAISKAERG
jgi:hypothetical protein